MLVLGLCIGQLKRQLTRHACVGAVVPHFAESTVFFYEDVQQMSSFFLKFFVIVFIN